jgi:glucose dehydrogenase
MRRSRRAIPALAFRLALLGPAPVYAADPEIDRLLQSPVGKDWVTNGGNLTNQRYSALKQLNTTNVKALG